jgi:hypothetical protein
VASGGVQKPNPDSGTQALNMFSATFFSQLGKEKENQLSRSFATCFNTSSVFRRRIIHLLHDTCRLPDSKVPDSAWQCVAEVRTPQAGGGRLDLEFSVEPSRKHAETPVFVIENKVEAKLTLKQLRKYKRHGVEYLIAVTKYPPDVSERQLKDEGVFALRWQDIHRHLSSQLPTTPVDRFLIRSLIEYLEELNMAFPEKLKSSDLRDLRRVLNVAASDKPYKGLDPKNAFVTADQCLRFLAELRRQLVERIPELEAYRFWGPTFYVWRESKDDDVNDGVHAFGWEIRGTPWWVVGFSCELHFPRIRREPIRWWVSLHGRQRTEKKKCFTLARFSDSNGTIRQEWLRDRLTEIAKKWRVAKVIKQVSKRRIRK